VIAHALDLIENCIANVPPPRRLHILFQEAINLGKCHLARCSRVAIEEIEACVDEVEDGDELLVHLPEHEVERPAQIDVLDRALD
jgi:hypothetical protein